MDEYPVVSISLVIPMFGVERYLPDLLKSFEQQNEGAYSLEYVFVDDGSPDASGQLAEEWLAQTEAKGTVVRKTNGGVSSARNLGLEFVTGDWVTFPDPDDFLDKSYFVALSSAIKSPEMEYADIVSANVHRYIEQSNETKDTHTLRFRFQSGQKCVSLAEHPEYFQMQSATSLFRVERVRNSGIKFMEGLHSSEDALFVADYLLLSDAPSMGVVPGAIYYYRRRSSGDSAIDTVKLRREAYFDRFERGYLPRLLAASLSTSSTNWFENQFIYELRWLFIDELDMAGKALILSSDELELVIELFRECLGYIGASNIMSFSSCSMSIEIRAVLLGIKNGEVPLKAFSCSEPYDAKGDRRLNYYFVGKPPTEVILQDGVQASVLASKYRQLNYFGQSLVIERILWLSGEGNLTLRLNGLETGIHALTGDPSRQNSLYSPRDGVKDENAKVLRERGTSWKFSKRGLFLFLEQHISVNWITKRIFSKGWLFVDRLYQGHDNAEHLYRYVRQVDPGRKIFFILNRDSACWKRLKGEGFKLLAHRGLLHRIALHNASLVVSSHIDVDMIKPIPESRYDGGKRPWKFVFLQHGVIKDDMSTWLNQKDPSLFVTTTVQEHESLVGDYTPYRFSTREVVRTGLPRHDRLIQIAETAERNSILIVPTWRNHLLQKAKDSRGVRQPISEFYESNFHQRWMSVLNSQMLLQFASERNLTINFLPHPSFSGIYTPEVVPSHIRLRTYEDDDVQELLASSSVLVTDFSSVAFDAALIRVPIVYFQFDNARGLGNIMTEGYFDYERDGFGPVCDTSDAVVQAIIGQVAEHSRYENYRARVDFTFLDTSPTSRSKIYDKMLSLE